MTKVSNIEYFLPKLRDPETGQPIELVDGTLYSGNLRTPVSITDDGIPIFAKQLSSAEAKIQQTHYEKISAAYIASLSYPHTKEYNAYLDNALLEQIGSGKLGDAADLLCGACESFGILSGKVAHGIGIDISLPMLRAAREKYSDEKYLFVQGDALALPLAGSTIDTVVILGGIHHVNNRSQLFDEVARVLKPGGRFIWREPLNDFFVWRLLRYIIYRLSPALDWDTEHPLRYSETKSDIETAGFRLDSWKSVGFLGFCLFMNSDVLIFNKMFRFIPGIRRIVRVFAWLDDLALRFPPLKNAGLQVIGTATKMDFSA